jgi:hypothetical protein
MVVTFTAISPGMCHQAKVLTRVTSYERPAQQQCEYPVDIHSTPGKTTQRPRNANSRPFLLLPTFCQSALTRKSVSHLGTVR